MCNRQYDVGSDCRECRPIKAKYNELKTDIKADAATIKKLARLLTDPQVKAALESFPERYFEADSGLDEVNMLGKLAPMVVIAVVTLAEAPSGQRCSCNHCRRYRR